VAPLENVKFQSAHKFVLLPQQYDTMNRLMEQHIIGLVLHDIFSSNQRGWVWDPRNSEFGQIFAVACFAVATWCIDEREIRRQISPWSETVDL